MAICVIIIENGFKKGVALLIEILQSNSFIPIN